MYFSTFAFEFGLIFSIAKSNKNGRYYYNNLSK